MSGEDLAEPYVPDVAVTQRQLLEALSNVPEDSLRGFGTWLYIAAETKRAARMYEESTVMSTLGLLLAAVVGEQFEANPVDPEIGV